MITFARELLCEVVQEVQPLLEAHYQELCINKDFVRLDPRWDVYAHLEQAGAFVVLTARDEGRLVGYAAYFVNRHLHYSGLTVAQNDVLFLVKESRRGTAGLKLIDHAEKTLRELGASKIVYHIKLSMDWRPILHRRGYRDEEIMCGKMLIEGPPQG